MNKFISIFFLLFSLSAYSQLGSSTIKRKGENVYISSKIDGYYKINYWFKKCMANDLFTFYRVSIANLSDTTDIKTINEAYSDNIGPFEIQGGGWCGGNHLYIDDNTHTAETISFKLSADGKSISSDTIFKAREIKMEVENLIFNPLSAKKKDVDTYFTDTLCIEYVIYTISGNSIQVDISHKYTNKFPVTIAKYYGMQSVFKDEHQLLTPSGKYTYWTDIDKTDRFKKKDFPKFNRYIEKNDFCFQSSYLLNCGLGNHNELSDDDVIFIGNSWTKCYHKLIGNMHRIAGNYDFWSGSYTWITTPLLDTESVFAYNGFIDGKNVIYFSNNVKGNFIISLTENLKRKRVKIIENTSDTKIRKKNGSILFSCTSPGSLIIAFEE